MATAAELRADAARMREFARTVTDLEVLFEINEMIVELERRAREMANGHGASCSDISPAALAAIRACAVQARRSFRE